MPITGHLRQILDIDQSAIIIVVKEMADRTESDSVCHRTRFGRHFVAAQHSDIGTWERVVIGIVLGNGVRDSVLSLNEPMKPYPFVSDTNKVFEI